jgi:hypothetical protein
MLELTKKDVVKQLSFPVEKRPLQVKGIDEPIDGKYVVLRTDTNRVLGYVSDKYDLQSYVDTIVKPLHVLEDADYTFNRVLMHNDGARVVVEARSKEVFKIRNDDYQSRILLVNSYDTSSSFRYDVGLFRLICSNGAGIWRDHSQMSFIHKQKQMSEFSIDTLVSTINNYGALAKDFGKNAEILTNRKITNDGDAMNVLSMLGFSTPISKKVVVEWQKEVNFEETAYGLYNGITSFYSRMTERVTQGCNNLVWANKVTSQILEKMIVFLNTDVI